MITENMKEIRLLNLSNDERKVIARIKSDVLKKVKISITDEQALFFFNDTATTEIYTLSLHDALPISKVSRG